MPYDKATKTVTFPDTVPIHRLGEGAITPNMIDGGFTPVKQIPGLGANYLGGNVTKVGLCKKYGFHICPEDTDVTEADKPKALAIYVMDGRAVTPEGRDVIRKCFTPSHIVRFGDEDEKAGIVADPVADAEAEKKKEATDKMVRGKLAKAAAKLGITEMEIRPLSNDEIKELMRARKSGKEANVNVNTVVESVALLGKDEFIPANNLGKRAGKANIPSDNLSL